MKHTTKFKELNEVFTDNYTQFAKYTITDRAIPALEDGCKNIHRKIIWSMYVNKQTHDRNRVKANTAVGLTMAYSCHGNSSIYGAIVRFANDSVNIPLIDGKGAFSSHTSRDVGAGADRYVEIRLSPITQEYLKDIDKNISGMKLNYDETKYEPIYLPVTFPTILANPNMGIATGIATNICAFPIEDIVDNTINIIDNKPTKLMIPDFSTGGQLIYDLEALDKIQETGVGMLKLRCTYKFENNSIIITEIPYSTTREEIIESIIKKVKDGKTKDIVDINDHTGKDGLKITIELKKSADKEKTMIWLFKNTPLESTFGCNFNVLCNGVPKTLGTIDIIKNWIKFRYSCVVTSVQKDIDDKSKRLHLLKGLEKVLLDIDKAVNIIRFDDDPKNSLMKYFKIDEEQTEYILNIKLRNINKEYIIKQVNDNLVLENEIQNLTSNINNRNYINDIIKSDLLRVKKLYSYKRKTKITTIDDKEKLTMAQLKNEVPTYNVHLLCTKEGYVKKLSLKSKAEQKLKDGDYIVDEFDTTNDHELIVFSGTDAYKIQLSDLSDSSSNALGDYLPTKFDISNIIGYSVVDDRYKYLLILYNNGKLAKVDLKSYVTTSKRKKLSNSLNDESNVIKIFTLQDDIDIILINSKGKTFELNTNELQTKASRNTQGVVPMQKKNIVDIQLKYTNSDIM